LDSVTLAKGGIFVLQRDFLINLSDLSLIRSFSHEEKVTVPNTVVTLAPFCFYASISLSEIDLAQIRRIEEMAFSMCLSLEHLTIPKTVEFIDGSALITINTIELESGGNFTLSHGLLLNKKCSHLIRSFSLNEVTTIPASVEVLAPGCFQECSVKGVCFEAYSQLVFCAARAFYCCDSLKSITIPREVTQISEKCFCRCTSLVGISWDSPSSIKEIGKGAFECCCSLQSIIIPFNLEKIGEDCFNECELLCEVVFQANSNLKIIGRGAFCGCCSLHRIDIPESVECLGERCFSWCESLKNVRIGKNSNLKRIEDCAFLSCVGLSRICIPVGTELIGRVFGSDCVVERE
jgi:hypothetical protein